MIEKPPLGLRPRKYFELEVKQNRINEIIDAMSRYSQANKPIPIEWIDELRQYIIVGDE